MSTVTDSCSVVVTLDAEPTGARPTGRSSPEFLTIDSPSTMATPAHSTAEPGATSHGNSSTSSGDKYVEEVVVLKVSPRIAGGVASPYPRGKQMGRFHVYDADSSLSPELVPELSSAGMSKSPLSLAAKPEAGVPVSAPKTDPSLSAQKKSSVATGGEGDQSSLAVGGGSSGVLGDVNSTESARVVDNLHAEEKVSVSAHTTTAPAARSFGNSSQASIDSFSSGECP